MTKKTCILSGGGINGVNILGFLYADSKNNIKNIDTFVTFSVSSIIIFLLLIGYDHVEILHEIINSGIKDYCINVNSLRLLISETNLYDFDKIDLILRKLLYEKLKITTITLKHLFDITGRNFVIGAYNLKKHQIQYFDNEDDTNDAIKIIGAACSLPFVFKPVMLENAFFSDVIITGQNIVIPDQYTGNENSLIYVKTEPKVPDFKRPLLFLKYIQSTIVNTSIDNLLKTTNFEKNPIIVQYDETLVDFYNDFRVFLKLFDDGCRSSTKKLG